MNCGRVAGQTVMHFHCHVIPRYGGDMAEPAGGVRHCVSGKGYYQPK
jgi:diadenosine tetraphosphate (Ap4A) HIT family hydrolase